MMKPISFIAVSDPDASRSFYGDILGLTLIEESPFALVFDDAKQMLRVQIVERFTPVGYTVHGWHVPDVEQSIRSLVAKGVAFESFEGLPQDNLGVWITPDKNKIAWFKDPCGNILSLTQFAT